jgi:anti-sigma factor RsiW
METKLKTCPNAEQTIVGYIDGNLSATEHIAFERHMASCSVCRTIERELRMTQTLLRTLPSVEPRQDFEARLAARIADVNLKPSPWWMRLALPSYVKPARRRHVAIPVVAVASVVASLGFVYVSRVPNVKAGAVQTAAASDETEVLSELANQHHAASATQSLGDTSGVVVVASDMATGGSW